MTAPVGSGGGANLGTAYGRVRVDYESSGVSKAIKDVEALQSTLVRADAAMASSGKTAGTVQSQVNHFAAQMQQAAKQVEQYSKAADAAQKRADAMSKRGIKGQQLIDAKGLAASTQSELAKSKAVLVDWQRYVNSIHPTLQAPKTDVTGVRSAVQRMKEVARQEMLAGAASSGSFNLSSLLGLGSGGSGIAAAGANIGKFFARFDTGSNGGGSGTKCLV